MSAKTDKNKDPENLIPILEESLSKAESESRAKTAFHVKMSQDIKSSINVILEYSEAARKTMGSPEKQLDCLNKIDYYGQALLGLINQVLDMTGFEADVRSFGTTLTLPERAAEPPAEEKAAGDFSCLAGKHVLLADDNEMNRQITKEALEACGISVTTASNGRIAADTVISADAGTFDFILMDLIMPEMDGYEAAKAIRALPEPEKSRLPILAMSASTLNEDIQKAKDCGMDALALKPIRIPELLETLQKLL